MDLINNFTVLQTADFENELENIIYYIRLRLKEPLIAKRFYNNVINKTSSLNFMPERYMKIDLGEYKKRNIRRIPINDYIIIYEVNINTRSSFCFTYISL